MKVQKSKRTRKKSRRVGSKKIKRSTLSGTTKPKAVRHQDKIASVTITFR